MDTYLAAGALILLYENLFCRCLVCSRGIRYGMFRATQNTFLAVKTALPIPYDLDAVTLTFGVSAPAAAQGAALEKDSSPDTRTVIDAEFLNIKDQSFALR